MKSLKSKLDAFLPMLRASNEALEMDDAAAMGIQIEQEQSSSSEASLSDAESEMEQQESDRPQKRKRLIVELGHHDTSDEEDDTSEAVDSDLEESKQAYIEMSLGLGVFDVHNESGVPSNLPVHEIDNDSTDSDSDDEQE